MNSIEYSDAVLEEIRAAVMDAFFKIPRGGLEIGGVLFGRHSANLVRIESCRMLACDYASGPSFTLSATDHARLRDLLDAAAAEGLLPVGWFRSRTRSGISLSEDDVALSDTYFREPWQVVLVLRPEVAGTMRFFTWGRFPTCPVPVQKRQVADPSHARAPWIAVCCLGLVGGALGARQYLLPPERLSLEVFDRTGQLQLSWDRSTQSVRRARGAKLEITDGETHLATNLAAPQLQQGSFYYARRTERVDIHLTVIESAGRSTEEYATFLGPLPPKK